MRRLFVLAGVVVLLAATGLFIWYAASEEPTGPQLAIRDAYIPRPASPDVAAAYFTVTNRGDEDDTLQSVRASVAGEVMMHRNTGSRMEMVTSVRVPADGELSFSRGELHVMLDGVTRPLQVGDSVELVVRFEQSGEMRVRVPVRPIDYRPAA